MLVRPVAGSSRGVCPSLDSGLGHGRCNAAVRLRRLLAAKLGRGCGELGGTGGVAADQDSGSGRRQLREQLGLWRVLAFCAPRLPADHLTRTRAAGGSCAAGGATRRLARGTGGGRALASWARACSERIRQQRSAARTKPHLLQYGVVLGDPLQPVRLVRRELGRYCTRIASCSGDCTE